METGAARPDISRILEELAAGDSAAASRLLPLVYEELREMARRRLANEPPGLTLQATALVHEAYLRLVGNGDAKWENRGHFFGAAAEAMRRILVERARKYRTAKHGGQNHRQNLDVHTLPDEKAPDERLLALDEALSRLEATDQARSQVVKLRYFAGLTIEQTASAMGLSTATVERYWTFAKAWLRSEMLRHEDPSRRDVNHP